MSDLSKFLSVVRVNQKDYPEGTAELVRVQLQEWFKREQFQTVDEMLNVVGNNINEYLDYVVNTILSDCAPARSRLLHYEALSQRYMSQTLNKQQERINEAVFIEGEVTLRDEIKQLKEVANKLVTQRELERHIEFHRAEILHHTVSINEIERQLEKL